MHIEQVFDEQVKFLGTDAALVIMEVVAEEQPHLPCLLYTSDAADE